MTEEKSAGDRLRELIAIAKERTICDNGWLVYYSGGDTAVSTPDDCLFEFENLAAEAVRYHFEEGGRR